MTIHKQTSLNFDDEEYIILAQTHSISITVLYNNHPCQDIRKSSLYSLSVPSLTASTNYFCNTINFECFVNTIIYFQKFQQYLYITKLSVMSCIENKKYSNNIKTKDTFKYNLNIDNSQADKFEL